MSWRRKDRPARPNRSEETDELSGLWLHDGFVEQATVVELSAEQRAAKERRDDFDRDMEKGFYEAARAARLAHRAKRRRRAPAVLAIVAVVVSVLGWRTLHGPRATPQSAPPEALDPGPDRLSFGGKLTDRPPPSTEQAQVPLGRPAPHNVVSEGFKFTWMHPGTNKPIAYDPCRPIHVVVNDASAPPGAEAILSKAVAAVRKATGLTFIVDGPTDEVPSPERSPYQPDRYGKRWAPVLVAWSDDAESPALAGPIAGSGGSMVVSVGDDRVYVTGGVTLDGPQLGGLLVQRGGQAQVRAVIQHELGHLVGLDHVSDAAQLMNPDRRRSQLSFGAGDLTGLGLLGEGRCFPTI